jgi:hypothetical protein
LLAEIAGISAFIFANETLNSRSVALTDWRGEFSRWEEDRFQCPDEHASKKTIESTDLVAAA